MLTRLAQSAIRAPKRILVIAGLLLVGGGIFGGPVASHLLTGGFTDPAADSTHATSIIDAQFHGGQANLVFLVSAKGGADSAAARTTGTRIESALAKRADWVTFAQSYWTSPPGAAAGLRSKDGKYGLVVTHIKGNDNEIQVRSGDLAKELGHGVDGASVQAGGAALAYHQVNDQTKKDLALAEAIAIPLTAIALILVFGSVIAALIPLAVGIFSIIETLAILRTLSTVTDVSIYAMNMTTALGLALAIDYSLFMVSRYREELKAGREPDEAIVATVRTAGRTVLFSALTVGLSLSAMIVFPMYFLRSFAYAGIAVVALAAAASIIVLPACLALIGTRVNALDLRVAARRALRRPEPVPKPLERGFWYRLSGTVMRRPIVLGLAVTAIFVLLGAPFLRANFGYPDDRIINSGASARTVGDVLRTDFTQDASAGLVGVTDSTSAGATAIAAYTTAVSKVDGVESVTSPAGTFADGKRVGPVQPGLRSTSGDGALFNVATDVDPFSSAGSALVHDLRNAPAPWKVYYSGAAAFNVDAMSGLGGKLPLAIGLIAFATFVVLFLFTGSVVAPDQGARAEHAVVVGDVRGDGVDLPGGPPVRAARLHPDRLPRREHGDLDVLPGVRDVHGLRGVPAVPNPRGMGELGSDGRRQPPRRRTRPGAHRANRHRGSSADGHRVRRHGRGEGGVHAAVRAGPDDRGARRRHPRSWHPGARVHAADGPAQLVGTSAARPAARPLRPQRGRTRTAGDGGTRKGADPDRMTRTPARRRRASRGSGEQLREEIIAATKDLLAESASSDAVSIRAVADAVGVTSPSIYLHFADKDALIEAVVADVFAELDAAMVAAGNAVELPLAKLRAYGLAYVKFAVAHPGALPGGHDGAAPGQRGNGAPRPHPRRRRVRALHADRPAVHGRRGLRAGRPAAGHAAAVVGRARHRIADDRQAVPAVGRRRRGCRHRAVRGRTRPGRRRQARRGPRARTAHRVAGRAEVRQAVTSAPRVPFARRALHTTDRPSSTAQWTTLGRALELNRDDRILTDGYAPAFLSEPSRILLRALSATGPVLRRAERLEPAGLAASGLCRHRFIDEHLVAALPGVEQVVILGAGYDSRAYRFTAEIGARPVYEVDLPPLSRRKAAIVASRRELFGHASVHRVEIDFRTQSLQERLAGSGFVAGAPTFVAWEGVSPYLTRTAVTGTLDALAAVCGSGSTLAMDFWQTVGGPLGYQFRIAAVRAMHLIGEPVTFDIAARRVGALLASHGFAVADLVAADAMTKRYATGGRSCDPGMYVVAARLG